MRGFYRSAEPLEREKDPIAAYAKTRRAKTNQGTAMPASAAMSIFVVSKLPLL